MSLVIGATAVALFLGFGAVQELIVRGVNGGELQPLFVGIVGAIVSMLLLGAGVALWRRWPNARSLAVTAGALSVAFHVYAALPPHRNVGPPVLIVGAGYGVFLLIYAVRSSPGVRGPRGAS